MTDSSLRLLKGTLDVLILKTISWGPAHGYAISRWIRESSGDDLVIEEGAFFQGDCEMAPAKAAVVALPPARHAAGNHHT